MEEKSPLKHGTAEVERLIPYARNARVHSETHVAELAGSIREFGFNVPVLIDQDFNIIAGHGRVLAARKLGMIEVPVVYVDHLNDTQRRAFILADNKLHDNSSFDYEILHLEMEDLKGHGFDLALAGFDTFELTGFDVGGLPDLGTGEITDDQEGGSKMGTALAKRLVWGTNSAPITDKEYEALTKALEDYTDENGVSFGFVSQLLGMNGED